jgi:flagellar biogenesis protein FliO
MKKKITRTIVVLLFVLTIFLIGSYYLRFSENQETKNNQLNGKKEFSEFLIRKKKLPQTSEEVSLIAVGMFLIREVLKE